MNTFIVNYVFYTFPKIKSNFHMFFIVLNFYTPFPCLPNTFLYTHHPDKILVIFTYLIPSLLLTSAVTASISPPSTLPLAEPFVPSLSKCIFSDASLPPPQYDGRRKNHGTLLCPYTPVGRLIIQEIINHLINSFQSDYVLGLLSNMAYINKFVDKSHFPTCP